MFGMEGKKIVLAPLFYDKVRVPANGTSRVSEEITQKYRKIRALYHNPDTFVIAESMDDVYDALARLK